MRPLNSWINGASCPPTPLSGQVPPQTYDDMLDEYLDKDSDAGDLDEVFNAGAEASLEQSHSNLGQDNSADALSSPGVIDDASDTHSLSTPQMQRTACVIVDRAARRANLQPYHLAKVDAFMKASTSIQLGLLFVNVQAVQSEISRVLVGQPRFTVDEALHKTVSAYSLGVLLSEKLREYKRSSTDIVLTIIRNNNTNVPSNLDQDPYAMSTVKAAISDALTQARSRIKKLIGKSIDENLSIYLLASKVIEGSQCTVSIPLCARLAVLRHVYANCNSGLSYWNEVDACLAHCRAKAKGNADRIRQILAKMLKLDRSTYGILDKISVPKHVSNFQQAIDDSL